MTHVYIFLDSKIVTCLLQVMSEWREIERAVEAVGETEATAYVIISVYVALPGIPLAPTFSPFSSRFCWTRTRTKDDLVLAVVVLGIGVREGGVLIAIDKCLWWLCPSEELNSGSHQTTPPCS